MSAILYEAPRPLLSDHHGKPPYPSSSETASSTVSLGWAREHKRRMHTLNSSHSYPAWANDHTNATCSGACGLSTSSWANAALHHTANADDSWANSHVLDGLTLAEAALEGLSDVSAAMDHLQEFLELLWGNHNREDLNERAFAVAFAKAFEREATALVHVLDQDLDRPNLRAELSRQDMYQVFWHQAQSRQQQQQDETSNSDNTTHQSNPPPFVVVDMQPLVMGMVEFTLQQQHETSPTQTTIRTVRFHAWTRHGQVTRLEHEETNTVVFGDDPEQDEDDDDAVLVFVDQPEATGTVAASTPVLCTTTARSVRTDRAPRPPRRSLSPAQRKQQRNNNKKRVSVRARRNRRKVVAL